MLHEEGRLVKPVDIKEQVDWANLEGVVILGLNKKGKVNTLQMSTLTVEELALLSLQLQSHLVCMCGPMEEV